MAIKTIKTLKLTLDAQSVECQLTRAALVDTPDTEELTTFCGTETSAIPNYDLEIGGFQDYGDAASLFDLIHAAYVADPIAEIDCVLTVGKATRTFTAKPVADVPFGGDAGAALTGTTTLDVVSQIVDGVLPVTGTAGTPGTWTGTPIPLDAAAANSSGTVASPTTAWTTGQYVQGATAGASGEMHWDGSTWVTGRAA